eukprot:944879-Alexandrium_andersonii.AAC.1
MSASLVGSEMCIRDRCLLNSPQLGQLPRYRNKGIIAAGALWSTFPASPVSYTHLTLPTICSV